MGFPDSSICGAQRRENFVWQTLPQAAACWLSRVACHVSRSLAYASNKIYWAFTGRIDVFSAQMSWCESLQKRTAAG